MKISEIEQRGRRSVGVLLGMTCDFRTTKGVWKERVDLEAQDSLRDDLV